MEAILKLREIANEWKKIITSITACNNIFVHQIEVQNAKVVIFIFFYGVRNMKQLIITSNQNLL